MKKCLLIISIFLYLFTALCYAHPGRTDKYGGHTNKETGEYHYHNADGSVTVATKPDSTPTKSQQTEPEEQIDSTVDTPPVLNVVVDGDKKPLQNSVSEILDKEIKVNETEEIVKVVTETGDTIIYVPHKTPYSAINLPVWIVLLILASIGWCIISSIIYIYLKKLESKHEAFGIILHIPFLLCWLPSLLGNLIFTLYRHISHEKSDTTNEVFEDDDDYEI